MRQKTEEQFYQTKEVIAALKKESVEVCREVEAEMSTRLRAVTVNALGDRSAADPDVEFDVAERILASLTSADREALVITHVATSASSYLRKLSELGA